MSLISKMPRDAKFYDLDVYPLPNDPDYKYIIMYNGVNWSLAFRGPGFYDRLGTYDTKVLAQKARNEHRADALRKEIAELRTVLDQYEE